MNNKYAFFIHPMTIKDVAKKYRIAKKVNPKLVAGVLKRRPPFVLSDIEGLKSKTGAEASGFFVAVPLLPWQFHQLDEDYVLKKLSKSCKVAQKEGARIVGLGAHTAIPGDGGRKLAEQVQIAVTTGNTYTVAAAIEGTLKAAEMMNIELYSSTLVVLGGTGSIGSACVFYLAPFFERTIVIGRSRERLDKIRSKIDREFGLKIHTSTLRDDIEKGDVVITVTGDVNTLVDPGMIKPGAVVCDVARPRDVSKTVAETRDDVLVIDGGVICAPGDLRYEFDMGLPRGVVLACMAETMILALENRFENYTLAKDITHDKIKEMQSLAEKHGFKLAGLRSFDRVLSERRIEKIRKNARERMKVG